MMTSYCTVTVAMTTDLCDVISLESWQNWVTVVTHCLAWWSVGVESGRLYLLLAVNRACLPVWVVVADAIVTTYNGEET